MKLEWDLYFKLKDNWIQSKKYEFEYIKKSLEKDLNKHLSEQKLIKLEDSIYRESGLEFAYKNNLLKKYIKVKQNCLEMNDFAYELFSFLGNKPDKLKLDSISQYIKKYFQKIEIVDGKYRIYVNNYCFDVECLNEYLSVDLLNPCGLFLETASIRKSSKYRIAALISQSLKTSIKVGFLYLNNSRIIYPIIEYDSKVFELANNLVIPNYVFYNIFRFEPFNYYEYEAAIYFLNQEDDWANLEDAMPLLSLSMLYPKKESR